MLRRVSRMPISKTSYELADMDFAEYGRQATFLNLQDAFATYSIIVFICNMERAGKHRAKWRMWP